MPEDDQENRDASDAIQFGYARGPGGGAAALARWNISWVVRAAFSRDAPALNFGFSEDLGPATVAGP
jgi:hypothetical protein